LLRIVAVSTRLILMSVTLMIFRKRNSLRSAPERATLVDNAYKDAIDATKVAVAQRLKSYRILVAVVLFTLFAVVIAASGTWSLLPLSGLIFLWPAFQVYMWMDGRVLANWRMLLIRSWAVESIALKPVCDTLSQIPGLPRTTLTAMLATLPGYADLRSLDEMAQPVKEAAAHVINTLESGMSLRMLAGALVTAATAVSLVTCVVARSWIGLAPIALIPAIAMLASGVNQLRWRRLLGRLSAMGLNSNDSRAVVRGLKGQVTSAVSDVELDRLARALG
jgi:hypothetical protein